MLGGVKGVCVCVRAGCQVQGNEGQGFDCFCPKGEAAGSRQNNDAARCWGHHGGIEGRGGFESHLTNGVKKCKTGKKKNTTTTLKR